MPAVRTIVAIVNQKGGVGKSTTAINLAAYLAGKGERVLVVDMDAQGNATSGLGVSPGPDGCMYDVLLEGKPLRDVAVKTEIEGLDVAPATINLVGAEVELVSSLAREFKLKRALEKQSSYDRVLLDCPPSLDLLTLNVLTDGFTCYGNTISVDRAWFLQQFVQNCTYAAGIVYIFNVQVGCRCKLRQMRYAVSHFIDTFDWIFDACLMS